MCNGGGKYIKGTQRDTLPPPQNAVEPEGWQSKDYLSPEAKLLTNLPCSTEYRPLQSSNMQAHTGEL